MCCQQGNRVHRGDLRLASHKDAGRIRTEFSAGTASYLWIQHSKTSGCWESSGFLDNAASESLQTGDRDVRVTLGAVNEIVRKMGSMPGQRALILILTMTPEALTMKSQIL